MNKEFITALEIENIIKEFGSEINIYSKSKNEFGENVDDVITTTVFAYFYEKNKSISLNITLSGQNTSSNSTQYRLMVSQNEHSNKIKINDELVYNDDRYKIIDLGKFETSYYDMFLEKV